MRTKYHSSLFLLRYIFLCGIILYEVLELTYTDENYSLIINYLHYKSHNNIKEENN